MNDKKIPGLGLTYKELQRARAFRAKLPVISVMSQSSDCSHEYHEPTEKQLTTVVNITINHTENHYYDNRQTYQNDNRQVNVHREPETPEYVVLTPLQRLLD